MVRRRQARRRRNNANNSRVTSLITRLSTGIPSRSRVSRDPPNLPSALTIPIRIRFDIVVQQNGTSDTFEVILPSTPAAQGQIRIKYSTSVTASTFAASDRLVYLDSDEIWYAAAMRVFGVQVDENKTSANYIHTEYALQKVSLYGGTQVSGYGTCALQVDFGSLVPGFVGRDAPGKSGRAVISCSAPRLEWRKFADRDLTSAMVRCTFSNMLLPTTGLAYLGIGTLDVTVMVRRSYVETVLTTTKTTTVGVDSL